MFTFSDVFQYDFGNRFDMVLMMPDGDIGQFHDHLMKNLNRMTDRRGRKNFLDFIDDEISKTKLAHESGEVELVMPQFTVTGDIDIASVMRKVEKSHSVVIKIT